MSNSMLEILLGLIDPLFLVPTQVKKRIEQEELSWIKTLAIVNYLVWPTLFILLFFVIDQNKTPLTLWRNYRFLTAGTVLTLGCISYFFRNNPNVIKFLLFITATIIPAFVCWSMTFGYPIQIMWIILVPTLIFITISRSFVFPVLWLLSIIVLSKHFWYNNITSYRWIITDTFFAIIILIFGYIAKRIWIDSKTNKFLNDDLIMNSIEQQIEFDRNIKRFISPVLVKRIEEKTSTGQTLVMALDDVLMRKEAPVAVMFTDMRNFSTRSVDIDFVENELVPSSSKIIDGAEDNMGIAKQIGDAVFVYYAMEDAEEGLLRATKDSVKGCLDEKQRIKILGRTEPERFFSIAYGPALVGNMASFRHREATVIGSPANLSARMDSLTKEPAFKILVGDGNKVLVSKTAKDILKSFNDKFEFNEVNLEEMHLIMKSFPDEKHVYLFTVTEQNINALNEVLTINNIRPIEANS